MLYDLGIRLFGLGIRFHSFFNAKSKDWIEGRKKQWVKLERWKRAEGKVIWFHTSSLGEFEQALPVMQALKKADSTNSIVVSFFSPSGYNYRKDHPIADLTFYMPLDTKANANRVINLIRPDVSVMTKYDLWKNHLEAAKKSGSKLILFAARFTNDQYFFKPHGAIGKNMLKLFNAIHVQETASHNLLKSISIMSEVSGDTRYDRVMGHVKDAQVPGSISEFCGNNRILVAGSTWPEDEKMLAKSRAKWPEELKVIIAPHDISASHINGIQKLFPDAARFSKTDKPDSQVLIIDNIGLLSSLYKVADVAYIGGAFGPGLHNILEASAFGVPVIYGHKTRGHPEADDMETAGFATKLSTPDGFTVTLNNWLNQDNPQLQNQIQAFMNSKTGATKIVAAAIHDALGITTKNEN
ncbi:MAG: 3-deoxy-D-manno-octulosonic-acid transferase [Granulosicoccus sp.]|jgi:3-deoxy-D-manno-octulosonic-acid transferase